MKPASAFYEAFKRAGMLVPCTWFPRSNAEPVDADVRFRRPTEDHFSGAVIAYGYSITYPEGTFPGAAQRDEVRVTDTTGEVLRFRIREIRSRSNGTQQVAELEPIK